MIETVEEEHASELLAAVARELGMPLFDWTVTRGRERLPGEGGESMAGWTSDPFQLLAHLEKMMVEAIFHLKDFSRQLEERTVLRQLREVAKRFSDMRPTIVFTGQSCPLPGEVSHYAVHFDPRLPGPGPRRCWPPK